MGANAVKSIQTITGYKIAYFISLSIVALGLLFFEMILAKGKVGCSQGGSIKLLGSFAGVLSIVAIVGLPIYTLILLYLGEKIKSFIAKMLVAFIPSAFVIFSMISIFNIYLLEFVPYVLLALYPSILLVTNFVGDNVESDDIRDMLHVFPIILIVGDSLVGGYFFLSLF